MEKQFVTQMGTLVVVLETSGETVPSVGGGDPKGKIGVQEIFRGGTPIELGEYAGQEAQLGLKRLSVPANQTQTFAEPHRPRGIRIGGRFDAEQAHEKLSFFGIGQERAEHVV